MVKYNQKRNKGTEESFQQEAKSFWDDCLELESHIRSNTAHGIYKWDGEVLKIIMSGEMSHISKFCEFEWFKSIMFQDETALYPNDQFRLGRYLGPSIDIGPPLKAKIIKENDQVLHGSMYQAMTQEG